MLSKMPLWYQHEIHTDFQQYNNFSHIGMRFGAEKYENEDYT